MTVVRLEDVTKGFGRRPVLTGVSLDVRGGVLVRVRGANGSGKSTLLRLVAGLSRPTSGLITWPEGRVRVAYAPERGELGSGLRVGEYLHHMARIAPGGPGSGAAQGSVSSGDVMDRYGLNAFRDAPLRTVSKGTLKKVALAQAFLDPADLVVLDEPADGLDPDAVAVLRADVGAAVTRGAAVVVASHTDDLDRVPVPRTRVVVEAGTVRVVDDPAPAGRAVRVEVSRGGVVEVAHVDETDVGDHLLRAIRSGAQVRRVEPLVPSAGPAPSEGPALDAAGRDRR